jgi:putative chitinase
MFDFVIPTWLFSKRKAESRARRSRVAAQVQVEILEGRPLLAIIVTGLTGDAGATYTKSDSVSPTDLLGNTYQFTAGQGASINVSLEASNLPANSSFVVYLSDHAYGTPGIATIYAHAYAGNGTTSLPEVTGDRSHYYYVSITGFSFASGQLPYTLTITTGSGEPQPDLAITSAALNQYNNAITYGYTASNDPGTYTVSAYRSTSASFTPTSSSQPFATQTITTTGTATGGNGTLNFPSLSPSTTYPYVVVYISGALENDYSNNSVSITVPPLKPTVISLSSISEAIDPSQKSQTDVNVYYTVTGSDLPPTAPLTTVSYYWASGPTLSTKLEKTPLETVFANGTRAGSTVYRTYDYLSRLGSPPANASYLLAALNSAYADPAHNVVSLKLPSVPAPGDVNLDSANIVYSTVNSSSTINFVYQTVNNPKTFEVGLYQSPTATFNISQDTLLKSQEVTQAANSSGKGSFTLTFIPQPSKPYLLVVVNPDTFVPQSNGNVHELPAYLVSVAQLQAIMTTLTMANAQQYVGPLNEAMEEFQINTPKRAAGFLAQLAWESSNLTHWVEQQSLTKPVGTKVGTGIVTSSSQLGYTVTTTTAGKTTTAYVGVSGPNFKNYDPTGPNPKLAKSLGNTNKGDGSLFRGRGPIQVTGRYNYTQLNIALGLAGTPLDLVENPSLLSTDPSIGFRASSVFWNKNGLNQVADTVDPSNSTSISNINTAITKKINPGLSHLSDRLNLYTKALAVLNA